MIRTLMLALTLGVTGASAANAQEAMSAPNCPADAVPLPAALAAWQSRNPLAAASDGAGLAAATVQPGTAIDLQLKPTPGVHYAMRPERPGGSVSNGGMIAFAVSAAGTYRIALGSAAWIDVVGNGAQQVSTAHGQGPACSGIRKMVDFALQPGTYVLQIVGNGAPSLPVMVARLP